MTDAPEGAAPRDPRRHRRGPLVAIVAGVLALLGAGILLYRAAHQPPPWHYVADAPTSEDPGVLKAWTDAGIALRRGRVVAANGNTLARFRFADGDDGRVLLDWQPAVDPPFLTLPVPPEDLDALAPVLARHVADGEPVLAWWDTSRQLALLQPLDFLFHAPLGTPRFLPASAHARGDAPAEIDAAFWGHADDADAAARFAAFRDALLADPADGVAALNRLAGNRKAVLVLHVRDLVLLGQLAPQRLGVAFRDFANTGNVHGMVPAVRAWLRDNHYPSYTVMRAADGKQVRAVALTDTASGATLAARLLPLVGNDQSPVPGTLLVYKTGGFWVYEIGPGVAAPPATP